jgi:hypothetical protein
MSKTIESLRRFPTKEEILFQDHIVDTYFYKKTRKKKNAKPLKYSLKKILLVAVPASAVALALAFAVTFFREQYVNFLKDKVSKSRVILLFKNGSLNNEAVRRLEFRGHAKGPSRITREGLIVFNNPRKYGWADMVFNFAFPLDLKGREVVFSAKGRTGGERIDLVLRDRNNRSARISGICMTSGWRTETVTLDDLKDSVELSSITQLRLESAYTGESAEKMDSPIDLTIYVKDMQLTMVRRVPPSN